MSRFDAVSRLFAVPVRWRPARFFRLVPVVCVAAGIACNGIAVAQVDEIFVVAQKKGRAENLQEVPAAITAFNEDQIDSLFFQKLDDLSYTVPNVQLEQVGTFPGVQNFSIRGQGINSSIPSVDPTVGTFVDGVYLGTTFGVVIDSWDLESIEVLRGPQGLLFGRNVTGGAVLVRTARPDPNGEFGLKAKALATDEERYGAAIAIESPLVEGTLAGKLVLYYDKDDGYFENNNALAGAFPTPPFIGFNTDPGPPGSSQRNAGELETKIARPSFVWTPTDTLEVALIAETGATEGDGAAWTVVGKVLPLPGLPPSIEGGGIPEFSTTLNEYGYTDINWDSVTLEINWDVLGGTLTNIAGWRDVALGSATDVDGSFLPAFVATGTTDQDQWSNELRFATTIGDFWDLTAGIYYLDQDIDYREGRYIQINPATLMPAPDFIRIALGGTMETETYGVFWNNDITFAEDWTVTLGLRYSNEDKDAMIISGPAGGGGGRCEKAGSFDCARDMLSGSWNSWTPKLGLAWRYDDNSQLYAFWTKGFRTGGFNFRNAKPTVIPPGPTEQEEQNSYEIGLKTEVFDNRLRMNLAYFWNDIDDIQRELNVGDPDVLVLQGTINAGDVEIRGVEFEFVAVPNDQLSINGAVGYLDGDYKSKNPAFAAFLGDDLPRLAPWSFSLGAGWDQPIGEYGLLNFRADYGYRDGHPYDDANTQFFTDQHRLQASINWISPADHWTVSLFGKNLTDEPNYGNLTSIAGLYTAGPMQKGREYGIEVQYRL